ncbi:deoxyribose-phosphate aldolase [Muricauda sp. CAU 1633]|uniref:deoxyribose-phosphate aldolase n=1 Tax=Allomuricauda sp. CAU 1633 TaxID=2816036 RepID=UPI001A8F31B8|nr:deoxyribose-phosphate aldolase [Muricauda sp. CAU 1633]MBO0323707.1 deoxyribose-phosphate aldolase [Muricauda sp. CAU 1633]
MFLPDFIDHTNLKPTALPSDIKKLCEEAINHGFYAVCVNGCHVSLAKEALKNSKVNLAAVVGFPLGAMSTKAKVFEAKDCVENGADEIDMVINLGWLRSNNYDLVRNEIQSIKQTIGSTILKVIIETCYLTTPEKEKACTLAVEAGADFVKTSTGFGSGGATFEDIILMKRMVGDNAKIKASGGIKDKETALKYIELGVSRIGTSSGPSLLN